MGSQLRAYVGLDLAASVGRCSGYACIICDGRCVLHEVRCLHSDDEIVSSISALKSKYVTVVSIDAPFSLGNGIRLVDRKMMSLGFKVLPPGFNSMRKLTLRAMELVRKLNELGVSVYETHPRSALISSKCASIDDLLHRLSINYSIDLSSLSKDLKDAVIAAVVSYCIDLGCYLKVDEVDGIIWLLSTDICIN